MAFTEDGERLSLISSVDANAARLVWVDIAGGPTDGPRRGSRSTTSSACALHPDTNEPQIVVVPQGPAGVRRARPGDRRRHRGARAALEWRLRSCRPRPRRRTWLVGFTTTTGRCRYYAYDRAVEAAHVPVRPPARAADYELAPMEPFTFTARDGLEIHGYLTFPAGAERRTCRRCSTSTAGRGRRDAWGFDPEAQWLANRGYLCVQVNFRGSTGYGKDFVNAGDKRVGRQDARRPARRRRVGRRSRDAPTANASAIYGGSYGGYAALVGATFTPDVFRCAVDIVGPSNLKTLIESIPPYWAPMVAQFHTRVGNPETEEDVPVVALAALEGRRDQDPDAHRPGRQRPARQAGRDRADRRGHAGEGRSSTSTCCSRTRATASPSPRTA